MLVVVTFVTLVRDCVYQIVMLRFLHFFDLKMYNITLYYQRFLSKVKYYFGTKRLYKFKKNEVKYVPTTNFHILEKSIIKVDKKTKLALKTAYCDFFLFCRKKNVK